MLAHVLFCLLVVICCPHIELKVVLLSFFSPDPLGFRTTLNFCQHKKETFPIDTTHALSYTKPSHLPKSMNYLQGDSKLMAV